VRVSFTDAYRHGYCCRYTDTDPNRHRFGYGHSHSGTRDTHPDTYSNADVDSDAECDPTVASHQPLDSDEGSDR
jgi:hypothetical protein